jgi:membrane-bound serine protease (ClpP class)
MEWTTVIVLVIAGLLLMALEVYVPGFVVGSIGAVLLVIALFVCYNSTQSMPATLTLLAVEAALGLAVVFAALKFLPNTALGRRMNLAKTLDGARSQSARGQELIGRTGTAQSILRPAGVAIIDGRRLDVVAESGVIERDTPIKVVALENNQIIVRKA